MKYLLQQPKTLEKLALVGLVGWVTVQAEDLLATISKWQHRYPTKSKELLSRRIKSIRNFIQDHLPDMFYNQLASELLKTIPKLLKKTNLMYSRQNVGCSKHFGPNTWVPAEGHEVVSRVIETVFTKHLTRVSLVDPAVYDSPKILYEYNTWDIFKGSFCSSARLLSGLQHLELNTRAKEADILLLLKELHCLKSLSLRTATDTILKCIADNCKLLERLEMSFDRSITDSSMDILTRLRHLKHVNLTYTDVTKKGVAALLLGCDNIERIDIHPTGRLLESALEDIVRGGEHAGRRFQLKYYYSYIMSGLTGEQLQLVLQMCPKIQKISFSKECDSQYYLQPVQHLSDLREMYLGGFEFYADGVKELLEACGSSLLHVDLRGVEGLDLAALATICQTCPNMESIYFYECSFVTENSVRAQSFNEAIIPPLQHLKKITLSACMTEVTDKHVIFLLTNSPNVEYVDIRATDIIMNDIMMEVMAGSKNLAHLKELKIYKHGVSKLVIDLIVQNCVRRPEVIVCDNEIQ